MAPSRGGSRGGPGLMDWEMLREEFFRWLHGPKYKEGHTECSHRLSWSSDEAESRFEHPEMSKGCCAWVGGRTLCPDHLSERGKLLEPSHIRYCLHSTHTPPVSTVLLAAAVLSPTVQVPSCSWQSFQQRACGPQT